MAYLLFPYFSGIVRFGQQIVHKVKGKKKSEKIVKNKKCNVCKGIILETQFCADCGGKKMNNNYKKTPICKTYREMDDFNLEIKTSVVRSVKLQYDNNRNSNPQRQIENEQDITISGQTTTEEINKNWRCKNRCMSGGIINCYSILPTPKWENNKEPSQDKSSKEPSESFSATINVEKNESKVFVEKEGNKTERKSEVFSPFYLKTNKGEYKVYYYNDPRLGEIVCYENIPPTNCFNCFNNPNNLIETKTTYSTASLCIDYGNLVDSKDKTSYGSIDLTPENKCQELYDSLSGKASDNNLFVDVLSCTFPSKSNSLLIATPDCTDNKIRMYTSLMGPINTSNELLISQRRHSFPSTTNLIHSIDQYAESNITSVTKETVKLKSISAITKTIKWDVTTIERLEKLKMAQMLFMESVCHIKNELDLIGKTFTDQLVHYSFELVRSYRKIDNQDLRRQLESVVGKFKVADYLIKALRQNCDRCIIPSMECIDCLIGILYDISDVSEKIQCLLIENNGEESKESEYSKSTSFNFYLEIFNCLRN